MSSHQDIYHRLHQHAGQGQTTAIPSMAYQSGKINMKKASSDSTDIAAKKGKKALATTATRAF